MITLRPARRSDAPDMARLADLAGQGLPAHLWARIAAPGESVWDVGARRAARDEGAFSWRNATLAEVDGVPAGMVLDYPLPDAPPPEEDLPPMALPLRRLEDRALGAQYLNMLAVFPGRRRLGVAARLVTDALARAAARGARDAALITADGNAGARAFYAAQGFAERAREPLVAEDWETRDREWILLVRPLQAGQGMRAAPAAN